MSPEGSLDEIPLDQLRTQLSASDPRQRMNALRALGRRRGINIARLIDTCSNDSSGEVRELAKQLRVQVREETTLFGPGEKLRIELPAPVRTAEEERRSTQLIWVTWGIGGMIAITALLVQEHTGMIFLPIVASFIVMLTVLLISMRLINAPSRVGWMVIDPLARTVVIERIDQAKEPPRLLPFAELRSLSIARRSVPAPEGEPPAWAWEATLELSDQSRMVVARRETREEIDRVVARLKVHMPLTESSSV